MKHTAQQPVFLKRMRSDIPYVFVGTIGNKVYARQRTAEGAPIYVENKYTPTYFLPIDDPSVYVGIDGVYLEKFTLPSLYDGKGFLQQYQGQVYGDIQPEYMLLADTYGSKDVPYTMEKLYLWNIDIEVDKDPVRGHSPVDDPFNPIISICVLWRHMGRSGIVVYGTKPYTPSGDETYVLCEDERDLLKRFLADWRAGGDVPDILTGYNIEFYDVPYLVNRMRVLFDDDTVRKLSPFEVISERKVTLTGREHTAIEIRGVAILDYFELYRKFTYSQLETYRLDHVAFVELGKRKVSYKEYQSLDRLYRENHTLFIQYNIRDTQLVDELEAKLKFIELVCALAYNAKANFNDTSKQVRLWDVMIYHHLRGMGREIPPRKVAEKNEQYVGAYVKDPIVGLHDWVVSFDITSMYPSIIRQWNLSPETIVDKVPIGSVDDLLAGKQDFKDTPEDMSIAANGVLTRKDAYGFLPAMLSELFDKRIEAKNKLKRVKKELEAIDAELSRRGMKKEKRDG